MRSFFCPAEVQLSLKAKCVANGKKTKHTTWNLNPQHNTPATHPQQHSALHFHFTSTRHAAIWNAAKSREGQGHISSRLLPSEPRAVSAGGRRKPPPPRPLPHCQPRQWQLGPPPSAWTRPGGSVGSDRLWRRWGGAGRLLPSQKVCPRVGACRHFFWCRWGSSRSQVVAAPRKEAG